MASRSSVTLMVVALLLMVGCGGKPAATPDLVATEVAVQRAAAATLTAEAPAQADTEIPVVTPEPENTVMPMDTPSSAPSPIDTFQKWRSPQVVNAFQGAGLEAENPRTMTKDDYGMAPMTAVEGTRFLIPSLGQDSGGRILSFAAQQDLDLMRQYYVELGRSSALFFSWVFVSDNVLVQINGDLPEDKAMQYEAALIAME